VYGLGRVFLVPLAVFLGGWSERTGAPRADQSMDVGADRKRRLGSEQVEVLDKK